MISDRTGLDPLPLADVDRGDPAAMRVVDQLDPARRLDGARRLDDFVDLCPGEPAEERQEQGGEAGDQRAREGWAAALERVACELDLALRVDSRRPRPRLSPPPAARRRRRAGSRWPGPRPGLADRTKPAALEQQHPVAGLQHRRAVGDQDDRASLARAADVGEQMRLGRGVQGAGRLVEDQDARVADDRARDGQELALPQRQAGPRSPSTVS